ncbi:tetratricopeptide repeat protein [Candidatus Uhrbacteria bacterium]|nr:tetratricopeptide repeat protein [Candidatus Uhrbacteria bacterium]
MGWFLLGLILFAVIVIGFVLFQKFPQLRVIDVDSIQKERERKVKEKLIISKFQRTSSAKLQKVAKVSSGAIQSVSRHGRRAVQRLYRLEQYYQRLKHSSDEGIHSYSDEKIRTRLEEADVLIRQKEYIPAEKIFIDIISHNPKNVNGYEGLGNMYFASGQLDQARESLLFALRLSPDDASVNMSLAQIELKQGDGKLAIPYARKAVEKRSKNPRYIDYYIDIALQIGSLKDARKGIQALKEVNPENQKIKEFEARFQEKKAEYVSRTTPSENKPSQSE